MDTVYRLVRTVTRLLRALVLLARRPTTPDTAPAHRPRGLRTVGITAAPTDDVVPGVDDVRVGGWRSVQPLHVAALRRGQRPDALRALVDARAAVAELDAAGLAALLMVLDDVEVPDDLHVDLVPDVDLDVDAPSAAQTEDPCLLTCSPHAPPAAPALRSARSRGSTA